MGASRARRQAGGRRYGLAAGSVLVIVGVCFHLPSYIAAHQMGFRMSGVPMGIDMTAGMLLVVAGLAAAGLGLMPSLAERRARRERLRMTAPGTGGFAAIEGSEMSPAHWQLLFLLMVGLVIDTMKPASLGFVLPGMAREYGLSASQAAYLPLTAIGGTVAGSLVWGRLGDVVGRRPTIQLSGLLYVATSMCGFMPTYSWNLVMCFLMGAAAGGMLPTVFSMMAESIPAGTRGLFLVLESGLGAALGYLIASGAATVLIPVLSWRSIWLLGAPTGLLLLVLTRWIPESPRFLLVCGRTAEAHAVMARFGIVPVNRAETAAAPAPLAQPARLRSKSSVLLAGSYRRRTFSVIYYALGWGVVNWGFVTFLPTFLTSLGEGRQASAVLFTASVLGIPLMVTGAVLYARWSSRGSMVLYALITVGVLVAAALLMTLRPAHSHPSALLLLIELTVLMGSTSGIVAMVSAYAAEIYPTLDRSTGSGIAAAAGKAGGLIGLGLAVLTPSVVALALVGATAMALSPALLWWGGQETAGRPLTEAEPVPTATS